MITDEDILKKISEYSEFQLTIPEMAILLDMKPEDLYVETVQPDSKVALAIKKGEINRTLKNRQLMQQDPTRAIDLRKVQEFDERIKLRKELFGI